MKETKTCLQKLRQRDLHAASTVRINGVLIERTEELLATGVGVLAVTCPFCMTMIRDGVTAAAEIPVYDIAEVVADRLTRVGESGWSLGDT